MALAMRGRVDDKGVRRPFLPAWVYVLGTIVATGVVVAIAVLVTTDHPRVDALHSPAALHTNSPATPAHARAHHSADRGQTDPPAEHNAAGSTPSTATTTTTTSTTTTTTPAPRTSTTTTPISVPTAARTIVTPTTQPARSTAPPSTSSATKFASGRLDSTFTTTSVGFSTVAGPVNTTVTWSGSSPIRVTLECGTATTSQVGTGSAYVALTAGSGACSVVLAERTASAVVISYDVAIDYRTAGS